LTILCCATILCPHGGNAPTGKTGPLPNTHGPQNKEHTMSAPTRSTRRIHNGDVRCIDCEHYDEEGCEPAAEALLQEGWPRLTVLPEDDAEATRCPDFSPAMDYRLAQDEEESAREHDLRLTAITNFRSW